LANILAVPVSMNLNILLKSAKSCQMSQTESVHRCGKRMKLSGMDFIPGDGKGLCFETAPETRDMQVTPMLI